MVQGIKYTFAIYADSIIDILLTTIDQDFVIQRIYQSQFMFFRKFCRCQRNDLPIHKGSKRFHQIAAKIECVKHIIMKQAQLCEIAIGYDLSVDR